MSNRFETAAKYKQPEEFTRHALAALESELRRGALLGLQDWSRTQIVSPTIFQSLCSLQRPSWGSWNGLITSLRSARKEVIRNGTPEDRKKAEQTNLLAELLRLYDQGVDADLAQRLLPLAKATSASTKGGIKWGKALTMPITLRNRIAHDNPTDPAWWTETSRALLPLILTLSSQNPFEAISPANGKYSSPWFGTQKSQVLTFNGIDNKSKALYVNDKGVSIASEKGGGQVLRVLQNLMGKTDMQEVDYRKLMGRLAPQDVKGVLLGDFLVGRPVGEGGFATVHVGRQLSTGRQVAVKILRDAMPDDSKLRFQQEAAFLARLQHPNIVSAISYGEETWSPPRAFKLDEPWFVEKFKKTAPVKTFIALEWVDGKTLDEYFQSDSQLEHEAITQQFYTAARAMQSVHDAKMIHRDIKPSNLMITQDDQLKVMDFGIARSDHEDRTLQTQTGHTMGTPAYMSPEQLRAVDAESEVGPATDVYSLCATFYELYTGKRVFAHDTTPPDTVRSMKLGGALPDRPAAESTTLPWEIETLLIGGLQPELSDRVQSMEALADDLERVLADRPIQYRRPSLYRRLQLTYRRNKAVANISGIAAAAIAVVALIAILLVSAANLRTQTVDKEREKQEELAKSSGVITSLSTAHREQKSGNLEAALQSLDAVDVADRGWEWFYLDHLMNGGKQDSNIQNQVRATTGRKDFGNVVDVAFHEDGRCFAAFKSGKNLTIIDVSNSEKVSDIAASGGITFAHISSDGKRAYTDNAYGYEIFDTATGKAVIQLPRDRSWQEVKFDETLQNYAVRTEQGVLINHSQINKANGNSMIRPADDRVEGFTFSKDGTLLATISDNGTLQVWNVQDGGETFSVGSIKPKFVSSDRKKLIEFSSNNKWVRVDNVVVNIARRKKKDPITLPIRNGAVRFISSKNQLLAVTPGNRDDSSARLQVFATDGSEIAFATADPMLSILKIVFRPDGSQVLMPCNKSLSVFNTATCKLAYEVGSSSNFGVAFSPSGNELAAGQTFEATIFNADRGQSDLKLDHRIGRFIDVVPNKNQFLTSSGFWSVESPKLQRPMPVKLIGNSVAVSSNGRYLASSPGKSSGQMQMPGISRLGIQLFDTDQSPLKTTILDASNQDVFLALKFSNDESLLAAVSQDKQLFVFDTTSGRVLNSFKFDAEQIGGAAIVISDDNSKVAVGALTGPTRVWDLKDNREISNTMGWGGSKVNSFSPDSRQMAALSGYIYDLESGDLTNLEDGTSVVSSSGRSGNYGAVQFLPDGTRLMTADLESVSIWDPHLYREMLKLPIEGVLAAGFTSDGRRLIIQTVLGVQILDAGPEFKLGPTLESLAVVEEQKQIVVASPDADFAIPNSLKKSIKSEGGDYEDPELGVTYAIPKGITIRPTEIFKANTIRTLPRGKQRMNMVAEYLNDDDVLISFISVMKFYEKVPEFNVENASRLVDVGAAIEFKPIAYQGKQIPLFELDSHSNGKMKKFAVSIRVGEVSYMILALGPIEREAKVRKSILDVMNSIRVNSPE